MLLCLCGGGWFAPRLAEGACNAPSGEEAVLDIWKGNARITSDMLCQGGQAGYTARLRSNTVTGNDLGPVIVDWTCSDPAKLGGVDGENGDGVTAVGLAPNAEVGDIVVTARYVDDWGEDCEASITVTVLKVELDVDIAWPWQSAVKLIAANSTCEIQDEETRALIDVTTDPPGFESLVTLSIDDFQPATGGCTDGTSGQGILVQNSDTQWTYTAYGEPLANLHPPETAEVTIAARISGAPSICSEARIRVYSAFEYIKLYAARKHLDGDAGASYVRAYNFIRCKYAFLNGVGDDFDSVVFSSQSSFPNPDNPTQTVPAYTEPTLFTFYDEVTFGTSTWGQENEAASIVGHELVHTEGLGINAPDECEAYQWEIDNANLTGINCGAGSSRVGEAQNLLQEYDCE